MNIDDLIITFCEDYIKNIPSDKAIELTDIKVIYETEEANKKATFDVIFWRGNFIYDLTGDVVMSDNDYANAIIDNSLCVN